MQCSIDMGRNNVTKKYKYSLGIFMYITEFQVRVLSSMYCTHCILLYYIYILLVCYNTSYNTVLLYTNNSNFLLISLQILFSIQK